MPPPSLSLWSHGSTFPAELFEKIFGNLGRKELRILLAVSVQCFHICVRLLYRRVEWPTYIELFKRYPFFVECTMRGFRYAEVVRTLVLGEHTTQSNPDATDWKLTEVCYAISQFKGLRSLSLECTTIPAYTFPKILATLPRLKHFYHCNKENGSRPYSFTPYRFSPWIYHLPQNIPNLTNIEFHRIAVDDRFGYSDEGVVCLAALFSLPSLTTIRTDITSWARLTRARRRARLNPSNSLHTISISQEDYDLPMSSLEIAHLLEVVQACASSLEILHVFLSYPVDTSRLADQSQTLDLVRLREFVGPEEFLEFLMFTEKVEVIWVPSPRRLFGVSPFETGGLCCPNLRLLSVGSWDAGVYSFHSLLAQLPNLEELSLTPLHSLEKEGLLAMAGSLLLCGRLYAISILCPPGKVPAWECGDVLEAWSSHLPSLQFVRFQSDYFLHRHNVTGSDWRLSLWIMMDVLFPPRACAPGVDRIYWQNWVGVSLQQYIDGWWSLPSLEYPSLEDVAV
ncbi:hypothetical protein PM082_022689 [Marasmius tenuissimus]|nr:hypothetical protein PM082_022689 [Marasmius tenuissimus]